MQSQQQNGTRNVKPGTSQQASAGVSRRSVLRGTTAAMGAAATFAALGTNFAWAQVSEEIKVGAIGVGGRGAGAVGNILEAQERAGQKIKMHAIGDLSPKRAAEIAKKHGVPEDRTFSGFDAYKQVLATDVELVILATPPGFRPLHFEAAVEAGKNIFFEKPIATDPTGVRKVIAAGKKAQEKKLACVTGTQRRHQGSYLEAIKRIQDGMIGDPLHMSVYWNGADIWWKPRPAGMTDMEYQVFNWYHHIWLCGDQICEQHIHNLDVANWVMGSHPISAYGMGGRQVRDKMGQVGEIWDHFAIEYEYPNGGRVMSMCRHWRQADDKVDEFVIGTKGFGRPDGQLEVRGGEKWRYNAKADKERHQNPYVQEHIDLLKSLKAGQPLNEAQRVAESTLTAICGRMSAYTGKKVMWDWAMNESKLNLVPDNVTKDTVPPPIHVPQPGGETKLV
jgi:myo-inositol 2-dehydrogenase / D-chiro-inositol 1-dehydrogenase